MNKPFAHSRFDSEIVHFYMFFFYKSYFPYDRQNGTCLRMCYTQDTEFENCFLIICRYLNLVKNRV